MHLSELTNRLDDRLRTAEYADVDASANGLQVGPGEAPIERIALAVDAAQATIDAAIERDADLLLTHHGLVWGGLDRVTGRTYSRIAPLIENDVALYVSHLPLDGHQELGNAAGLAADIGLTDTEPFGDHSGQFIGQRGRVAKPWSVTELRAHLDTLDQGGQTTQVLAHGPERIESVAIVTGSGADWLSEAEAVGADALVTGEGKQQLYHDSREAGVNVFLAGHYATETFGVRAVGELLTEWGVETTFIDHPTGL
jgi:dinuclear metal center YbgI/SA1388 family protein